MEQQLAANEVQIKPKGRYLRPDELTTLRNKETEQLHVGLKRAEPMDEAEEKLELQKLYACLYNQISTPRINRVGGRALAAWDAEGKAVQVLRKDGKFEHFGYRNDEKDFLEYYEALYLLELDRLQLEFHRVPMSVEQAYLLLLGESASSKYNEYLVYANLTRIGYILVRHQNMHYFSPADKLSEIDCIWALLLNRVQQKPIPADIKNLAYFNQFNAQMDEIKACIAEQKSVPVEEHLEHEEAGNCVKFDTKSSTCGKRNNQTIEAEAAKAAKRFCALSASQLQSQLDFLQLEAEYEKFHQIFEKFDVIKLKPATECEEGGQRYRINFDVYLHNDGFKKSKPKPPNFRIIVLDADQRFPTHDEISKCNRGQFYPVPLMIVSVNASKQIQSFLYHFT